MASAAFVAALEALGYGEAPERALSPADVSRMAMERAGTTDKRSRAYKSARRAIERRRTTGRESRGQPNRLLAEAIRRRGLRVHADLEIDPSPDEEPEPRPRSIDVTIPGGNLHVMAGAIARADLDAAEDAFWPAVLRAYEDVGDGEPSFLAEAIIGEIEALDIQFWRK